MKLWDVGESKCLDNVINAQGAVNCCSITTTNDEVEVQNAREVSFSYFW